MPDRDGEGVVEFRSGRREGNARRRGGPETASAVKSVPPILRPQTETARGAGRGRWTPRAHRARPVSGTKLLTDPGPGHRRARRRCMSVHRDWLLRLHRPDEIATARCRGGQIRGDPSSTFGQQRVDELAVHGRRGAAIRNSSASRSGGRPTSVTGIRTAARTRRPAHRDRRIAADQAAMTLAAWAARLVSMDRQKCDQRPASAPAPRRRRERGDFGTLGSVGDRGAGSR